MKSPGRIWRWPILLLMLAVGCHVLPRGSSRDAGNPLYISGGNQDAVWERTVEVLNDYPFEIEREDRLDGVIETKYKVGSGILEPWHKESVGHFNRWESTLQSIRRRVLVSISPVDGGFVIGVEAYKELEDLGGIATGGSAFHQNAPLQREFELIDGEAAPVGWIPQGRDLALEQDIQRRLQAAFGG